MSNPFKSKKTVVNKLDPASQAYVDEMRGWAKRGAVGVPENLATGPITAEQLAAAYNPYQQQVIDQVMADWGKQANLGLNRLDSEAAKTRSFGSRRDVAQGQFLGDLSADKMNQIASLRYSGYQNAQQWAQAQNALEQQKLLEPYTRNRLRLELFNLGMGPTGMASTTTSSGNWLGQLMGLAQAGYGLYKGVQGQNQPQPMPMPGGGGTVVPDYGGAPS